MPEIVTRRHGAIQRIPVGPIAVVDGAGVDGAIGVVPADNGGSPAILLRVFEEGSVAA